MLKRLLSVLALASASASAQFYGLATPYDGSVVYFTTSLRIKGTTQPNHGKLFAADESGVRLVESRDRVDPPADPNGACQLGRLYAFNSAEVSADGKTIVARGARSWSGICRVPTVGTAIATPSAERDYAGQLHISANARYAIADTTTTAFSASTATLFDLQSGEQKTISLPSLGGANLASAGRTITDDGTALLLNSGRAYLVRANGDLQPLPIDTHAPLAITPDGARVLYLTDDLHIRDLRSGDDWTMAANWSSLRAIGLSDDGSRAAFLRDGQLYVSDIAIGARRVTEEPAGLVSAVLSGDGKILYAVTATGRLLKISAATGNVVELVGSTQDIQSTGGYVDAGMFTTLRGYGFSEPAAVTIGGRPAFVTRVTPTEIDALVPWDSPPNTQLAVTVDSPPTTSPFDRPLATLQVNTEPRAGAISHQNWDVLVDAAHPPHTGEIIHIYAVGLGPVQPEPPFGGVAPSVEPLPRLAQPMTCGNAEVLYAGLAPGYIARIYQVDLRLGPVPGYQPIECTLGSRTFRFLTFNILP